MTNRSAWVGDGNPNKDIDGDGKGEREREGSRVGRGETEIARWRGSCRGGWR